MTKVRTASLWETRQHLGLPRLGAAHEPMNSRRTPFISADADTLHGLFLEHTGTLVDERHYRYFKLMLRAQQILSDNNATTKDGAYEY